MAEWLRRQIRTPFDYLFPFGSAGSNPAGVVFFRIGYSSFVLYREDLCTWVRHGRTHTALPLGLHNATNTGIKSTRKGLSATPMNVAAILNYNVLRH